MFQREGVLRLRPLFKAVEDAAVRAFEEHRAENLVTQSLSDEVTECDFDPDHLYHEHDAVLSDEELSDVVTEAPMSESLEGPYWDRVVFGNEVTK